MTPGLHVCDDVDLHDELLPDPDAAPRPKPRPKRRLVLRPGVYLTNGVWGLA